MYPADRQDFLRTSCWQSMCLQMRNTRSVWMTGELDKKVQDQVMECWKKVNTENVEEVSDIDGYWEDFYHMFGFHLIITTIQKIPIFR